MGYHRYNMKEQEALQKFAKEHKGELLKDKDIEDLRQELLKLHPGSKRTVTAVRWQLTQVYKADGKTTFTTIEAQANERIKRIIEQAAAKIFVEARRPVIEENRKLKLELRLLTNVRSSVEAFQKARRGIK